MAFATMDERAATAAGERHLTPAPPSTQVGRQTPLASGKSLWLGRIVSTVAVLFMLFDSMIKVLGLGPAVAGTVALGYPESAVLGLGIVELGCLLLYLIPRTSAPGAVLLTGYLGGAVATHVRIGSPLFTHTLFPVYVGVLLWAGLLLRNARLRPLLSPR